MDAATRWEKAFTAAQDVITDNLVHVEKITLWLTGSTIENGSLTQDHVSMHAAINFTDGGYERLDYDIPAEMMGELDTEKATFGYVVEYIINHLILPQYFAKFN